jgi:predicted phage tail protein
MVPVPTALIVAVIGAFATLGAYFYGHGIGKHEGRSEQQLVIDKLELDHSKALITANEMVDSLSHKLQERADEAEEVQARQKAEVARVAADLQRTRLERNGLRDEIAAALAGGQQTGDTALATCRERGVVAAELLDDGMSVQESLAGKAESCAADLRAVLAAWPSAGSSQQSALGHFLSQA